MMKSQIPIILFDGVCSLCHRSVQFCLNHENSELDPLLHFVSLQSDIGQEILKEHHMALDYLDSLLFKDIDGRLYSESEAVFKIARYLDSPFSLLQHFSILPKSVTDFIYGLVARYRYQIFGKLDQCKLPPSSVSMKDRFLS